MSKEVKSNENNLNGKATIFRLTLEKISFMYDGMFLLKLTVSNSIVSDKSGVRLRTKNSDKFLRDFSVRSEVIEPAKKEVFANFLMDEYNFYLPKGFCKNDMDHDVCLLIEALQVLPNAKTQLIGTVKLPIYPRSDVKSNYAVERGEPFYSVRASIRLLRPNIGDSNLHCGDLFYKAEFSEIMEIIELEHAPSTKPTPVVPKPPPIDIPEPMITEPQSPTPIPPKQIIEVSSSPIGSPKTVIGKPNDGKMISFGMPPPRSPDPAPEAVLQPAKTEVSKRLYRLLSPTNKEEISVFIHGADNVINSIQLAPVSYVICTLKTDAAISDSSHVTSLPTASPSWGEILNLVFTPDKIERFLSLKVVDGSTSEVIAEFILPVKPLEPFVQHHLKLCQSFPKGNVSTVLYVTIIRKLDHYPLTGQEHTFSALIIKPLVVYHQFHVPERHSICCFAYLSNNKSQKISKATQSIEGNFEEVFSPVSSNYTYNTSAKPPMWSSGQLSIPSSPQTESDDLNFPFLFCQKPEVDTAFTANSFIVLDFYCVPPSIGMNWRNSSPVGQSILKLDKLLYRQLLERDQCLINTYELQIDLENVPPWTIKATDLGPGINPHGDEVRVKVVLGKENISDGIYPESDIPHRVKKPDSPKAPIIVEEIKVLKKEPFLYQIRSLRSPPSEDYVFNGHNYSPSNEYPREIIPIAKTPSKSKEKKEFQYTNSLKKMQIELMNLREQCRFLKTENDVLERKLSSKKTRIANKPKEYLHELESLPISDLYEKYDKLRRGLGSQMSVLLDYKSKESNLRSALIADVTNNDPSDIYQKLKTTNEKLNKLEQKALAQEAIISRLEAKLDDRGKSPDRVHGNEAMHASDVWGEAGDEERNQLYDLIERSENRIKKLQSELIDLSRKRGARKQMLRIQEREKLFSNNTY